jgi:uncharacterized membrane protein
MDIINKISLVIGSIGVLVIVWGALVSAIELCIEESKRFVGKNLYAQRNRIRHYFSFYLLMGLEYLIGADIIRTLIRPTLQELAVLGAMVAIRTVTSYFLNKEMEQYHKGE